MSFTYMSVAPIRVFFPVAATVPADMGGSCQPGPNCGNHHGFPFAAAMTWTSATVRFSEVQQFPGGTVSFDQAGIRSVQFATDGSPDFDYWIDNVEFTTN
jgi:hypothetical protein